MIISKTYEPSSSSVRMQATSNASHFAESPASVSIVVEQSKPATLVIDPLKLDNEESP